MTEPLGTKQALPLFSVIHSIFRSFQRTANPTTQYYRMNTHPLLKETLKRTWQRHREKVESFEKVNDIKILSHH